MGNNASNARSGVRTSTTVVHQPQQSYGLQPQQSYSLTATVLVQNEARWLPEWLEYHLLPVIGVEHFYLYDDDSNGIGSVDELDRTLAPYVDAGLLTAHKVSALGPLPRHRVKTTDMRMCSRTARPWAMYRRVGSMCEREPFHFPQQAVAIQHAAATYGNRTRAMLLIDVDEFLAYEPSGNRYSARSAATALAVALSGRVGAVKLNSQVMLPDRLSWGGASDDRLFLTRNYSRQLLQPVSREERLRRGQLGFRKNVVDPRALGVLDGLHYYSTIHRVALRGDKVQKVIGHSLGLSLMHFRYRSATEWVARRNRTYMQAGAHGSAEKYAAMEKWQASLTEAMRRPQTHSKPQLALLPHWAALAAALVRRWRQQSSSSTPSAVLTLLNEVALVTSRVSVLLVSEPRSGSTLVGKLSFDARTDFLYSYEPCRMKAHPKSHSDGTFFGRDCALWAGAVLRCGLSLGDFNMLRRDKGSFAAQSSSSVRVLSAQRGGDEVEAYLGWMRRCWSSHRAAKVIRIREPAALSALMSLGDERLKIVHLTRDPERVVASRLSLRSFMRRGYFNPSGDQDGVVRATCDGMNAMAPAGMAVAPSELQRYEYEELLSSPFEFLRRLYSWLGLDVTIPESVMRMARQCRLGNQTGPALAKRRRFRVCELAPATGTGRKAPAPPKVQLSWLQRRQVMVKCHQLIHIMRGRSRAPTHWSMRDLANLTRSSVVSSAQPIAARERFEAPLRASQQIRFLVISRMRSASTTLVRALEATPGVTCLHELLNPGNPNIPFLSDRLIAYSRFSANASTAELTRLRRAVGVTSHAAAMSDLPAFMASFWRWCPTASCGFKVFDQQACCTALLPSSHFVSRLPPSSQVRLPATLEQLLGSGGGGSGGQKVRLIVLERRNVTAEHASWVRALASGNWGRTPAEQAAVASGQHGVAAPLTPSAASLATARTPLRMFRRLHVRWFARVRALARQAGAPVLSLSAEELMQGESARAAAVARARTFVTALAAPQTRKHPDVAGRGRLRAARRGRGRGRLIAGRQVEFNNNDENLARRGRGRGLERGRGRGRPSSAGAAWRRRWGEAASARAKALGRTSTS